MLLIFLWVLQTSVYTHVNDQYFTLYKLYSIIYCGKEQKGKNMKKKGKGEDCRREGGTRELNGNGKIQ